MKKGASLIWALLVSTALLFIAVTTASFVIKESQMSIRMDDSSRAYAAAESGIEWGKYCVENLDECDNSYSSPIFNVGGSQYSVKVIVTAGQTTIESLGTSNGVNRKLEHVITPDGALDIASDPITDSFTAAGSYVQQFDYWTNGSAGFVDIGIGNGGTRGIYMKHRGDIFSLEARKDGVYKESDNKITLASVEVNTPYALRVRIEYFKDLSAKMTISKRSFGPGSYFSCVSAPLVVDLRSFGLTAGDFTRFYYNPTPPPPSLSSAVGDGSVYAIISGASEAYFDNMMTKNLTLPMATGGSVLYYDSNGANPRMSPAYPGGYAIHVFTSSGTFRLASGAITADVLVVGGGGSGGGSKVGYGGGGGGGAGGVQTGTLALSSQTYTVAVGAGGAGVVNVHGNNGEDSKLSSVTNPAILLAFGGGAGGCGGLGTGCTTNIEHRGYDGGSGGGAGHASYLAGVLPGNSLGGGNKGGDNGLINAALLQWAGGGGGGGAGGAGVKGGINHYGGAGGNAMLLNYTMASVYYAKGGKGGDIRFGAPTNEASNTGNGGAGAYGSASPSGSGGSGVVIIKYRTP